MYSIIARTHILYVCVFVRWLKHYPIWNEFMLCLSASVNAHIHDTKSKTTI